MNTQTNVRRIAPQTVSNIGTVIIGIGMIIVGLSAWKAWIITAILGAFLVGVGAFLVATVATTVVIAKAIANGDISKLTGNEADQVSKEFFDFHNDRKGGKDLH
jgi:multisubunit Na+/H+ antiporter MnhG subunit